MDPVTHPADMLLYRSFLARYPSIVHSTPEYIAATTAKFLAVLKLRLPISLNTLRTCSRVEGSGLVGSGTEADASSDEMTSPNTPPSANPATPDITVLAGHDSIAAIMRASSRVGGARCMSLKMLKLSLFSKRCLGTVPRRDAVSCWLPKRGQTRWTEQDDTQLLQWVNTHGASRWRELGETMSPPRTAPSCQFRYHLSLRPDIRRDAWNEHEDKMLLAGVKQHGKRWQRVSNMLHGRSFIQVSERYAELMGKRSGHWTPEEDAVLVQHVAIQKQDRPRVNWQAVVAELPVPRTTRQAVTRHRFLTGNFKSEKWNWTETEMEALHKAVHHVLKEKGQTMESAEWLKTRCLTTKSSSEWDAVAKVVGTRNAVQCVMRWAYEGFRGPPGEKRRSWTQEEDTKLLKLVNTMERDGSIKWTEIASQFQYRPPGTCAWRYHYSLDPSVQHGPWTQEELGKLFAAMEKYGRDWKRVAEHIQTRNRLQCSVMWMRSSKSKPQ